MAGPWCDHATLAGLERGVALCLEASAVLLGATRDALTPTTPPKSLRACLASVRVVRRLADRMAHRTVATPDDDPPEAVRADAELRAVARALRGQAESLAADLTRLLDTRRARARAEILLALRTAERRVSPMRGATDE